jgi:triosephosphate isomerase (TIM)
MRIPVVVANWKMFKTVQDAVVYAKEIRILVKDVDNVEIVLAPPFTAVHAVAEATRNTNVGVAGQDVFWEREGAYTGEISAPMLKEAGADYVIIGHSERRTLFGDTDASVNRRMLAAIAAGMTPIVCVGETLTEREAGNALAVLDRQVKDGLAGLTPDQVASLILAYEPVWAIGTGRNATPAQAGEAQGHIRTRLGDWFGLQTAEKCRILYGGSVKGSNIGELIALPDVDGALVGGASLDVQSFFDLVVKSRPPAA